MLLLLLLHRSSLILRALADENIGRLARASKVTSDLIEMRLSLLLLRVNLLLDCLKLLFALFDGRCGTLSLLAIASNLQRLDWLRSRLVVLLMCCHC